MKDLDMFEDGHLGGYIRGGDPGSWCPNLWTWAVREHGIRSVLDVGCGEGHSTRFFQRLGCEVCGVEGCAQAVRDSAVPGQVALHDFCQGPYHPGHRYDLIWSCEFLEHVDRAYVPNILATFAHAAKMILITHAFPGQDGHHHVNCQTPAYWIGLIEPLGFRCDVHLSREARAITLQDRPRVNHFGRSGLVFVRTAQAGIARPTGLAALPAYLSMHLRAWRIHQGFRWSRVYRQHVGAYKAARRQEKRARRMAA
jgi:SAM-dependent methyltransferase